MNISEHGNRKPGDASVGIGVVKDVIDCKEVTKDMLRTCKFYRTKNSSVNPTRPGDHQIRLAKHNQMQSIFSGGLEESKMSKVTGYGNLIYRTDRSR